MVPVATAIPSAQFPWLVCGALGGYLLLMLTNPVRASLRDGFRCLRRYSTLWVTLGVFGFAWALFQFVNTLYFASALPFEDRPALVWMRAAWRDPNLWLHGSSESLWYLPPHALHEAIYESVLPALESTAGIFNCVFVTFPVAALAALLLLVNWQGHQAVMFRALRSRFGGFGAVIHAGVVVCALAAVAKPCLYPVPQFINAFYDGAPAAHRLWLLWTPVVAWVGFLFEYLFGVCMQIYLILLAYVWVRGLTFTHTHLLDFAIRRCSFVLKWALLVMLLSSLFIDLPLILKNFERFKPWFPDSDVTMVTRQQSARMVLACFLLLGASVQITLIFHSEAVRRALRDHVRFVAHHVWPFGWFVIVAALHLYLVEVAQVLVLRGLGEETAAGVAWSLVVPWLRAIIAAWLLASWVCLFKRCDSHREDAEELVKF